MSEIEITILAEIYLLLVGAITFMVKKCEDDHLHIIIVQHQHRSVMYGAVSIVVWDMVFN